MANLRRAHARPRERRASLPARARRPIGAAEDALPSARAPRACARATTPSTGLLTVLWAGLHRMNLALTAADFIPMEG